MTHILVFLAGASYECLFLLWTHAANLRQPLKAAFWAVCVGALSLYGVTEVVKEPGLAVALLGGYGAGSFVTVKWLMR